MLFAAPKIVGQLEFLYLLLIRLERFFTRHLQVTRNMLVGVISGASVMLAELAMEAGLPNGVLNIVHGTNVRFCFKYYNFGFALLLPV